MGDVPLWARVTSNQRAVLGKAPDSVTLPAFDPKTLSPSSLLTIANVAALLQVSAKTVRRLIDRGELDAIRIGRSIRIQPTALALLIGRRAG
jgi:excisionase family DNA binding protein